MIARPTIFFWMTCNRTGQNDATEQIVSNLDPAKWNCLPILFPAFERQPTFLFFRAVTFAASIVPAWARALWAVTSPRPFLLHLTLGQTWVSFARMGLPYLFVHFLRPGTRSVISFNGSAFMQWRYRDPISSALRVLTRRALRVTVLGPSQETQLQCLGIPSAKICIVPNSCELPCLDAKRVKEKHRSSSGVEKPVQVLHLSNLIVSKGYPEYLDLLRALNARPGPPVRAVLCGSITFTEDETHSHIYLNEAEWIEQMVNEINSGPRVQVEWIRGAYGDEKRRLFYQSHVFVFPSRYKVEAQPLVLLEAMAAGCAIVTSSVGEIPSTLGADAAMMLSDPKTTNILAAVEPLLMDPIRREQLALNAQRRFRERFSLARYAETWENLFNSLHQVHPHEIDEL